MYASLDFMTKGTKSIEVTLISRLYDPFFTIELRDDGGRASLMLSPDQLSQIITAATAAYTEWQPPVEESVVAGPTCDLCGREAKLLARVDGSDNYDWVTSSDDGQSYGWRCLNGEGNLTHVCTVDHKDYATKSFADLHPELVVK